MEDKPPNPFAATIDLLIVFVTLLAPALGGATLPWQQGAIVLAGALLMLVSPPARFLPRGITVLLGLVLLFAFAPFLPSSLAPDPWRQHLAGTLQLSLPGTITLQPWLTLEGVGLLFAGIVWGAFVLSRRWELSCATLLEAFAGGAFLLTLGAVAVYFSHLDFPLWRVEAGAFGFFPHRNQTATVLGLAGVVTLALFARRLHQRHWLALLWGSAYLLIAVGLVLNYSRAGILIFFFGSLAWLVYSSHCSRNYFALGMGLTGLFTLVALFVLFGGETWERFRPKQTGSGPAAAVLDFRVLVQQDALTLARPASWHGLGFGNLEPTLQQRRTLSANENRIEHPDSDWLWLWLELGLPGTLLLVAAIFWLLLPAWPFAKKSQRRLRAAGLVGVVLLLLHGFVDVSGHRLGTVWPVLLLFAITRQHDDTLPTQPAAPWAFRSLGFLLALLGTLWLLPSFTQISLPTSGRLAVLQQRISLATARQDHAVAVALLTEAIDIAPLDFRLYFRRAAARLAMGGDRTATRLDFARARHLEPNASKLLLDEGVLWLPVDRALALEAWQESLRRGRTETQDRFQMMILATDKDPALRRSLWDITGDDSWLKLMFLRHSGGPEFGAALGDWTRTEPPLKNTTPAQLRELFALWFDRGDRDLLEWHLNSRPEWRDLGAAWLAELAAARKDFKRAYEFALKSAPAPAMPPRRRYASTGELETEFLSATGGRRLTAGLSLALTHVDNQRTDDALAILAKVAELPGCPRYVLHLQSQIHAQKARWEDAWTSWKKYSAAK